MPSRQQIRMRLFPYGAAIGLFLSWFALLFLCSATIGTDDFKDFKVEMLGVSFSPPNLAVGWQGWLVPYFAIAIAVMLRWPSRWGWVWTLALCLISDLIGVGLLLLQISLLNLSSQFPMPTNIPLLIGLCALVLLVLQIISVSLVLHRRLFFGR